MQHIGTYAVERELGHGATGTVYLARTRAGRAVAVKVLHPGAGADAALDAARRVGGFHTAPVLDAGTEGDAVWFATAYVAAPTLAELLETRGPLDEEGLRRLGTGCADALRSVHGCGLVHGGLKPSDVLMADDGPRVRDFGLRAAAHGGRPGDPGADVHALGTLLTTAGGGDVARLPESLRGVVASCLDADGNGRPDPDALIEALTGRQETTGEAARGAPAGPPAPPYAAPSGAPPVPAAPPAPPQQPPAAGVSAPAPQGTFGPAPAAVPPAPAASPAPGGPAPGGAPAQELEFLAMDRKNDMVADAHGVSFTAHGHHTDLVWPHIRYVQHRRDAQGSTYHFTVSLVLVNGAQLACRVSTRNAWEADQWAAQLDAVLARFLPRPPQ